MEINGQTWCPVPHAVTCREGSGWGGGPDYPPDLYIEVRI